MANILEQTLQRFGYYKATPKPPDWLLLSTKDEEYTIPDKSIATDQMDFYRKLSWVQTAVATVARYAATTPFSVSKMQGEDTTGVENHPFEILLQRPNLLQSRFELLESTFSYMALTGNAYWWLNRRSEKRPPDELWIIPPNRIKPVPDGRMFIKGYLFETDNGDDMLLDPYEIVHFKRFNPASSFVGLSPIEAIGTVATGDLAQQRWNTNYFDKDNAKMPGALAFADFIDDASWANIKADVNAKHGGTKRQLMMLRNVGKGGVSWLPMAMSQKDMEFLKGRTFTKEEIYGIYAPGLASVLAVNATEANAKAGRATLLEFGVWPQLVVVSEKITNSLLPAYGDNLVGEFEDVRQTDRALELSEQVAAERVHTIDEIRQIYYQLNPLPDGRGERLLSEQSAGGNDRLQIHDYHINSGVITKEEARNYYGLPPTSAQSPTELEAKFKAVAAGEAIGIPPEKVFALVGLDTNLLPSVSSTAQPVQPRQLTDNQAQTETTQAETPQPAAAEQDADTVMTDALAEAKALRKWLKRRPTADPSDFTAAYLSGEQIKAIVVEVRGMEDGAAAAKSTRFIPRGTDEPLPPVPTALNITEDDIDRAIRQWDADFPQYVGMLNADVQSAGIDL